MTKKEVKDVLRVRGKSAKPLMSPKATKIARTSPVGPEEDHEK
jgi:hypothetical protein